MSLLHPPERPPSPSRKPSPRHQLPPHSGLLDGARAGAGRTHIRASLCHQTIALSAADMTACELGRCRARRVTCLSGRAGTAPRQLGGERGAWLALATVHASSGGSKHTLSLPQFCLHVGSSDPVSSGCRAWTIPSFEGPGKLGSWEAP